MKTRNSLSPTVVAAPLRGEPDRAASARQSTALLVGGLLAEAEAAEEGEEEEEAGEIFPGCGTVASEAEKEEDLAAPRASMAAAAQAAA